MRRKLSNRIADELRGELDAGRWKAGMPLPSVGELRSRFGAGEYAVRAALRRLRDEGLLVVKQGTGALATGKGAWRWRGRVAFVTVGVSGSYYSQMLARQMSSRLADAGWDFAFISIDSNRDKPLDLSAVKRHVSAGVDFAVCCCAETEIVDAFVRAGIPCVVVSGSERNIPQADAVVCVDRRRCFDDLVRVLKERGAKRLLEVDYERKRDRGFKAQLTGAGIAVRRLFGAWEKPGRWRVGDIREAGRRMVADYFADARNRASPPDVVMFDDDYYAAGGIPAILEAGFRIPDDIRVVAWSNTGDELAFGFSLARLENDPLEQGWELAEYVLKRLAGRKARPPRLYTRFIPGASL